MEDHIETQSTDAEHEQWFRRQVQIGIEEADAGNFIPNEEVEAEFASLRGASLRKLAKSVTVE
jgi:predicted transcriptional regulator